MTSILIVDDNRDILQILQSYFQQLGTVKAQFADSGEKALKILRESKFDLVLCDLEMPKVNGEQVARHLHQHYPKTRLAFTSGCPFRRAEMEERGVPKSHLLAKPLSLSDLSGSIELWMSSPPMSPLGPPLPETISLPGVEKKKKGTGAGSSSRLPFVSYHRKPKPPGGGGSRD